jgi:hypothetical protein
LCGDAFPAEKANGHAVLEVYQMCQSANITIGSSEKEIIVTPRNESRNWFLENKISTPQ